MRESNLINNFSKLHFHNSGVKLLPSLIKFIFIIFSITITFSAYGQVLTDYPCYSISEDNSAPNTLFEYDPQTEEWFRVGVTGGNFIEALATDPLSNTMYAADAGMFGTVDRVSAVFMPIGNPGTANGDIGLVDLDDIDGLTYDLVNQIMYASHRVGGLGPGTNDLLFQIDVATGKFVPGAMEGSNGNPADYAIVEEVIDATFGGNVYDVDDIAINPYTSELFAVQNQDGPSTITQIDPLTGKIIEVTFDIPNDDVEGLGFTYLGELYATTGDNGICGNDPSDASCLNTFIYIDLVSQQTNTLNFIDPTGTEFDFESFDCFTSFNDLALTTRLDNNTPQSIAPGDRITFQLTVYNQGGFDNHEITLTDYIPDGLILDDSSWIKSGNKATHKINTILKKGASVTVPVTFKIDENYAGTSIINAAEISSSYNPNIDSPVAKRDQNALMALPDIDSSPDGLNNETNIVNNEINQGGPNSLVKEDEDDHDIEEVFITNNSACIANLDLGNTFVANGVYQAGSNISCAAQLIGSNFEFLAGKEVLLLPGFSVVKITQFSADIAGCQ